MDKAMDSGSIYAGSIPVRDTIQGNNKTGAWNPEVFGS